MVMRWPQQLAVVGAVAPGAVEGTWAMHRVPVARQAAARNRAGNSEVVASAGNTARQRPIVLEISEIRRLDHRQVPAGLDSPAADFKSDGYAFDLQGWVVPKRSNAVAVGLYDHQGNEIARTPV